MSIPSLCQPKLIVKWALCALLTAHPHSILANREPTLFLAGRNPNRQNVVSRREPGGTLPLTVAFDTRSCRHSSKRIGAFPWPLPWTRRLFRVRQAKWDFTHIERPNQVAKMSTSTVEKSGLWISLSSLLHAVTSISRKENLGDKGRRNYRCRIVDYEELPKLLDRSEEKTLCR